MHALQANASPPGHLILQHQLQILCCAIQQGPEVVEADVVPVRLSASMILQHILGPKARTELRHSQRGLMLLAACVWRAAQRYGCMGTRGVQQSPAKRRPAQTGLLATDASIARISGARILDAISFTLQLLPPFCKLTRLEVRGGGSLSARRRLRAYRQHTYSPCRHCSWHYRAASS